jgi:serine/threonine kinase 16
MEQGGSMAMAVMGGKYKHPPESAGRWSAGLVGLIDTCLKVDPNERPDIHQVCLINLGSTKSSTNVL